MLPFQKTRRQLLDNIMVLKMVHNPWWWRLHLAWGGISNLITTKFWLVDTWHWDFFWLVELNSSWKFWKFLIMCHDKSKKITNSLHLRWEIDINLQGVCVCVCMNWHMHRKKRKKKLSAIDAINARKRFSESCLFWNSPRVQRSFDGLFVGQLCAVFHADFETVKRGVTGWK